MVLRPVFAGRTEDNELIVLYDREAADLGELKLRSFDETPRYSRAGDYYLLCPDGQVRALDPDTTEIYKWMDEDGQFERVRIKSEPWNGEAKGSRLDLAEAQIREA